MARRSTSLAEDSRLLSELIGLIYDAAAAPERWPTFLERLSDVLELRAAIFALTRTSEDGSVGSIPTAAGMDASTLQAYGEHFAPINPFRTPMLGLPIGAIAPGEQLMPDAEIVRTEFFNDFYAPAGLRHGFSLLIHKDASGASVLGCHRGPDQDRSSDADLELVRMLTPHLQRARVLAGRLGTLSSQERIVSGVLDRLPVGLVFVDPAGCFVSANARGQEILCEHDGLGLSRGRLATGRVRDNQALEAIIAAACECGQRRGHAAPTSLRLARPSGRRDLEVMACPIDPESEMWSDGHAAAFLVVSDGEAELRGVAPRLRDLYGLSEAESELAVALASGATVKEWAAQRGVSVETVRWQLKQVFAKTGTSRQPDLMRLMLLGPALMGRTP